MSKIYFIVISVVLAGGIAVWLIMSANESETSTENQETTQAEELESGDAETEQDEQSEMSSEPSTTIGETVDVGELETPEEFELPVFTNHFEITGSVENGLTITLLAIINRPSQFEEYQQQLTLFKQEALDYLSDNGVDTNEVDITYNPASAADL